MKSSCLINEKKKFNEVIKIPIPNTIVKISKVMINGLYSRATNLFLNMFIMVFTYNFFLKTNMHTIRKLLRIVFQNYILKI